MSVNYPLVETAAAAPLTPRRTFGDEVGKFIRTKPLGVGGALIILAMIFVAAFAAALAPYDPYVGDYSAQFARPSAEHWFGTDEFGRDVLSRIMYGARIALFVGFTASFAGCTLGALLGVVSAYCGGKVDLFLERLMDILLAFPLLILALAIASILGPAVQNVVVAIAIPIVPRAARVVRATALSVKEDQYVQAASYLGLGTAEPTPSWGLMLSGSAPSYAEKAPWIALFPGIAISLGVFGFNLFGDSLRDALDPKLRGR